MYNQFMADPERNSVRWLSERYHISMARVDAILRLKGLEAHMVKVRVIIVLCPPSTFAASVQKMSKNRLVLKTSIWLKTFTCMAF